MAKLRYAKPEKFETRHRRGERHPRAKFTAAQVRAIRKDRRVMREIARTYRCSVSTIWAIQSRTSYVNVP